MLSTIATCILLITTKFALAIPDDDITIAEFFAQEHHAIDQQPAVQERNVQNFSYTTINDDLETWTFGNTSRNFDISVVGCMKLHDVVGVYEFADGRVKYDATSKDIIDDLGIRSRSRTRAQNAAHTLKNARSAYDEIQAFLSEDILVKGTALVAMKNRRDIDFRSEGRILALVSKTIWGIGLGVAAIEIGAAIAGIKATWGQLVAGAMTMALSVSIYTIIDIVTDEGGLTGLEPDWMERTANYIANAFMARLRWLITKFRRSPGAGSGRRYTELELAEALDQLNDYSAWSVETTPFSSATVPIQGFCDLV